MKNTICLTALAAAAAGSIFAADSTTNVVIGWETWKWQGNPATQFESVPTKTDGATGLATQDGSWKINPNAGSNDGTFGTVAGASTNISESGSGYRLEGITTDASVVFAVEAAGPDLDILSFHFDALALTNTAATAWELEILAGGSLTAGVVTNGAVPVGGGRNLADFDIDLTGLADHSLSTTTEFKLTFSGGADTNSTSATHFDNVGLTADVPTPPTLALLTGWEKWSSSGISPSTSENGATGITTNGTAGWSINFRGSSADGTYGGLSTNFALASTEIGTNSTGNALGGRNQSIPAGGEASIEFVITETAGTGADLAYFHMDLAARGGTGVNTWMLEVLPGSTISTGVVASGAIEATTAANYLGNVDVYLADLADSRLDAGGMVTFRLTLSGATATKPLDYDNFAVSQIVPADEAVLVAWESWPSGTGMQDATRNNGVTGSVQGEDPSGWNRSKFAACNDGTFGGFLTVPMADTNTTDNISGFRYTSATDTYVDFSVANTSEVAIATYSFRFDALGKGGAGAPTAWSVEVMSGGSMTPGTVGSGTLAQGSGNDLADYVVLLNGLEDSFLDAGSTNVFRLHFTGGIADSGKHLDMDNAAITILTNAAGPVDLSSGIVDYSFNPSGTSSLSFTGGVSSAYVIKSSANLVIDDFTTTVTPAAVTVGSLAGTVITTDGTGAATAEFTESADVKFYQIETAP